MELGWIWRGWKTGIVTTPYPARPDPLPPGFRGRPVLDVARCRAAGGCAACVAACLPRALRLESSADASTALLTLDLLPCIMCGLCVQACPSGALRLQPDYELALREPEDARTVVLTRSEATDDTAVPRTER